MRKLFLVFTLALAPGLAFAGTVNCFQVEATGAADTFSVASLQRQYVTIKAHNANTDEGYLDCTGTPTTSTGFELGAGQGITFGSDLDPLDGSQVCQVIVGGGSQTYSVCEHLK